MRPINSNSRWFAAAVCVLATTGVAAADEAVVRVSDGDSRPGLVQMNPGPAGSAIQQTSYGSANAFNMYNFATLSPEQQFATYAQFYGLESPAPATNIGYAQQVSFAPSGLAQTSFATQGCTAGCSSGCTSGGWDGSCNNHAAYCSPKNRKAAKRAYAACDSCNNGNACNNCDSCEYGSGYQQRLRLLAGATPKGSCGNASWPKRWWRGQQQNYFARNQRLSNCLFGWLVPSGCCGQGCPPVGKYNITYADDPGYADGRDAQAYGVQGYGVPLTVPLAPNVRYSYNYSWGTPASRLTPVGQYDPQTSVQPLYRQCW